MIPTYKGVGLVRDKNGVPKVDNPQALHPITVMMLTKAEKTKLGLWTGPMARDAQGYKRLTKTAKGYKADDGLVAASEIYNENSEHFRLSLRIDVPIGGTFTTP